MMDLTDRTPVTAPTDPAAVYAAARRYVRAGLSLIPIAPGGDKRPAFDLLPEVWCEAAQRPKRRWSPYKERRPTKQELRAWFGQDDRAVGLAILGGPVSENLEILDLDNWDVVEPWAAAVARQAPDLIDRLVMVRSPRPGLHVYYRCRDIGGNVKLARVPETDPATGKVKAKTIIEVKATAGYCLAPPSPGTCHKSGRPYAFLAGPDLTAVPTITPKERCILHLCALQLNQWAPPRRVAPRRTATTPSSSSRPGDAFNATADWADILEPHGWHYMGTDGAGADRWCRPGKGGGVSATTNHAGLDLLYVFSSNADPFEENKYNDKFAAYALLNHGGDFYAAAADLRARGYGGYALRSRPEADDPYADFARVPLRSPRLRP
jgi:putative DNA primase/helicase